jgi:hypothetical protein
MGHGGEDEAYVLVALQAPQAARLWAVVNR